MQRVCQSGPHKDTIEELSSSKVGTVFLNEVANDIWCVYQEDRLWHQVSRHSTGVLRVRPMGNGMAILPYCPARHPVISHRTSLRLSGNQLITNWALRFIAHEASSCPMAMGCSSPYVMVSSRSGPIPMAIRYFLTDTARSSPRARL